MLPGDEAQKEYMLDEDLFIVAEGTTHAPGVHRMSNLIARFRGALEEATEDKAGLLSAEGQEKLDSLQTRDEIAVISEHARQEHVGLIIRVVLTGSVRLFRNLRDKGRIIRAYAETQQGSFTLDVEIEGVPVQGLTNLHVADQGTGLISISADNVFNHMDRVTAKIKGVSITPAAMNAAIFLLVKYDA